MRSLGGRGEGWVVAQVLLILAWLIVPRVEDDWWLPVWILAGLAGLVIASIGAVFLLFGVRGLGRNLTPFPKPQTNSTLVTAGIYGCVRHPIYGGLGLLLLGLGLVSGNLLRVASAVLILVFFDSKSRVEERWLVARYPEYREYRSRVRRMLPGLW